MRVYKTDELYVAVDDRGMVAPAMASNPTAMLFADPETFLRLAYTMVWVPANGLSQTMQGLEGQAPLWERPDPSYTMYDCGDLLIAVDHDGRHAPLRCNSARDDGASWRDPQIFMRRNGEGHIIWTSDMPQADEAAETAHYAAIVAERGAVLWRAPVPAA